MRAIFAVASAALAGAVAVVAAAPAHDHGTMTGPTKDRMVAMTEIGKRTKSIVQRSRTGKDLSAIAADARVINQLAGNIPAMFPPGSNPPPSEAKDAIWQNFSDFAAKAKALERESEKLMLMPADKTLLAEQARIMGQTCSACHDLYRAKR